MKIVKAKEKLYKQLRREWKDLITGVGIGIVDGTDCIVIYLSKPLAPAVLDELTKDYLGNRVAAKVLGKVMAA